MPLQCRYLDADDIAACRRAALKESGEGVTDMTQLLPSNLQYTMESIADLGNSEDDKELVSNKAAHYLYGIVFGHVYVDGNKRTGWIVSMTFLEANGFRINAPDEECKQLCLNVAEGNLSESDISGWISKRLIRI